MGTGLNFSDPFKGEDIGGKLFGSWGQVAADPLDVFGYRAEASKAAMDAIAKGAAERQINALREQYERSAGLQQPFLEYGQQALQGFGQYEQGPYFQQQLDEGRNALMGSAAAAGLGNSSYNANRLANFVNQLTGEDVGNQYMQDINAVRIGQGAVGSIGGAGQQFGSGAGQSYNQLANMLNTASQNYGRQRQQTGQDFATAMTGLSSYLGSQ